MKTQLRKKQKGLSDSELVAKYETGKEVDMKKSMAGMLKEPVVKREKPSSKTR